MNDQELNWLLVVTSKDYKLEKYYSSLKDFDLLKIVHELPRWVRLSECTISFSELN